LHQLKSNQNLKLKNKKWTSKTTTIPIYEEAGGLVTIPLKNPGATFCGYVNASNTMVVLSDLLLWTVTLVAMKFDDGANRNAKNYLEAFNVQLTCKSDSSSFFE
jgi:hypothetical protein